MASSVDGLASGTDKREKPLMTDMARLAPGRVGGQFWSVYINGTTTGDEAIRTTIEQIDIVAAVIDAYPRDLELASTADDVVRIHKAGRIASMLGIEGGRQIGGSLAALRQFYDLGVRYMTLTHNQTTEWADSATDEPKYDGLSPFGVKVVQRDEPARHAGRPQPCLARDDEGRHRRQPGAGDFLPFERPRAEPASAQRARRRSAAASRQRRRGDGQLRTPRFFLAAVWEWSREPLGRGSAAEGALFPFSKDAGRGRFEELGRRPTPIAAGRCRAVADHIEHVAKVAGHDHVGIGGDLDGDSVHA